MARRRFLGMILQRGGRSSVGNFSRVSKKNLMGRGGGGGVAKIVSLFLPCVTIGVVTGYLLGAYFAEDRSSDDEEYQKLMTSFQQSAKEIEKLNNDYMYKDYSRASYRKS